MKNLHKILSLSTIIVIGMMVFQSCKKDWLKPKPLSIFSPENTLIDVVGFNAALNGCEELETNGMVMVRRLLLKPFFRKSP